MSLPQSFVLSQTEGEKFVAGPFTITARATGPQTNGLFELYELGLGTATIDYHVHMHMDETLVVLEGEIEFNVNGTKFLRKAGSVAFVPRGVHHGFSNLGPAHARVMILFTPSGNQHEYFRELQKLFAAPSLDVAALQTLQKKYDQELKPLPT
jgi:mannose-6-phosphate isomerase-like protein (cupin superfamily)